MIGLPVEGMSVDDFLERLKKGGFTDVDECDRWVRDFFELYERQLKRKFKIQLETEQRIALKKMERVLDEEYQDVMLVIDDRRKERKEYFERIALKNKYRGRYNYSKKESKIEIHVNHLFNENTKRKT